MRPKGPALNCLCKTFSVNLEKSGQLFVRIPSHTALGSDDKGVYITHYNHERKAFFLEQIHLTYFKYLHCEETMYLSLIRKKRPLDESYFTCLSFENCDMKNADLPFSSEE